MQTQKLLDSQTRYLTAVGMTFWKWVGTGVVEFDVAAVDSSLRIGMTIFVGVHGTGVRWVFVSST